MIKRVSVIDLGFTNPYENLAVEEYLYENLPEETVTLFLWQNDNTVVVGQNQSVYSQCNAEDLKKMNSYIARRRSGGGAVYHDLGNLNYSFISPNCDNTTVNNMKIIVNALNVFCLDAEFSGRNDILICGKKVSGNAFYGDDNKICHHGTILVHTDFEKMYKLLHIENSKWSDKGIRSAESRTININEISKEITVNNIKESIVDSLKQFFLNVKIKRYYSFEEVKIRDLEYQTFLNKYSSKEWIFEKRICENLYLKERFSWGSIQICIRLDRNKISDCIFFSDCMEVNVFLILNKKMKGLDFCSKSINQVIDEILSGNSTEQYMKILKDIRNLLLHEVVE